MPSCVCVCVTSSKVISFFLGGLTFGAPVMHIWCILSMDSLRGQKSFSAPSCDVWPKMSENLLWIFPGSNWLNPEGQRCQSHSWRVSMKCLLRYFLNLLRLFSDVSGRQPPLIAAEINGSPVSRQSCTFNNAARNSSPFSLQLIYLCRFAGDPRLPSVFFLFVKLES